MKKHGPLRRAIARANAILPGRPAPGGQRDPRWQAIIRVGDFIETHPDEVCAFALQWAKVRGKDLGAAIYCRLIEHLLEQHFDRLFPVMRQAALQNARVAEFFYPYTGLWKFGQAKLPKNQARLRRLAAVLERQAVERKRRWRRERGKKQKKPPRFLLAAVFRFIAALRDQVGSRLTGKLNQFLAAADQRAESFGQQLGVERLFERFVDGGTIKAERAAVVGQKRDQDRFAKVGVLPQVLADL